MNIAVVGTGYVGLVTGTCLASLGNSVVCVDIDEAKVAQMRAGKVPIYEPGLEMMFLEGVKAGNLTFTTKLADAVKGVEVIFLALPTPPGGDGSADLSYVLKVSEQLGPLIDQYVVVVDKSTVPVGTAQQVKERIAAGTKRPFDVVSNPEFLREGVAVQDFMHPERIVVGASSKRASDIMAKLYQPYVDDGCELLVMDEASAELTKYASNTFLAMKISFMNEIANLCEKVGANVENVRIGVGADSRIGSKFLHAGIGYGGSCFPKDVLALAHIAKQQGYEFKLLDAVLKVNALQAKRLQAKVVDYYKGDVAGKTFALWGIAFKPDTDDIREAPALVIVRDLLAKGASVRAFDPEAMDRAREVFGKEPGLTFADSPQDALKDADALLIATEWKVFREVPLTDIKKALKAPVIFDGRNIYDLDQARGAGFYYASIGRDTIQP